MIFMIRGQVSLDMMLAIIIFLVAIGFLLNYTNDLEESAANYSENISGFNNYILSYDLLKSTQSSNFDINIQMEEDFNFTNKTIIFDANNNYIINTTFNCNPSTRKCFK
jgi:hypothetical protein